MVLSALTVNNVPLLLRALLGSRGADVGNLRNNRVLALVNTALEAMAYRIARGADYHGLRKDFAVTPVAGFAATIGTRAIFDLARTEVKFAAGGTVLVPVDSLLTLTQADLPDDQMYYAQEGTGLRFRDADGTLSFASPLTITANYIPLLSEVPVEYEGLFLNTLAGLMTEPRPEPRALELSEAGRA